MNVNIRFGRRFLRVPLVFGTMNDFGTYDGGVNGGFVIDSVTVDGFRLSLWSMWGRGLVRVTWNAVDI